MFESNDKKEAGKHLFFNGLGKKEEQRSEEIEKEEVLPVEEETKCEEMPEDVESSESQVTQSKNTINLDDEERFYGYNYGYVRNCGKLRVRKSPSESSDILEEINTGDTVRYNPEIINFIWYKVVTESGTEGYCMIDYIKGE